MQPVLLAAAHDGGSSAVFPWAALVAAVVALALYIAERRAELRDARRQDIAEAYKAAASWIEAVYRVRRRSDTKDSKLVDHLHDLQESIYHHRGLLAARSMTLTRAYDEYVQVVKDACKEPLQDAWTSDVRSPEEWTQDGDVHPAELKEVQTAEERFLAAARRHLSPWVLPRLHPWWVHRVRHHDKKTPTTEST